MSEERRHIAILFSDIVSYTKLMGSDENKALDMLSRNRTIHETHIKQFNGTLIKDIGDAILASFSLASDAVRCAIEIQKSCKNDNIPLKIGIHEGEVVFKNSDVFGDGVNIASRLQSDAQQGCINISGSVYRDIKNKSDIRTGFIGEKTFKNVDEPIKVYQVECGDEDGDNSFTVTKQVKSKSKKPYYLIAGILVVLIAILFVWKSFPTKKAPDIEKSIAILPFKNLSNNPDDIHLADGMMEAILNHLQRIEDLSVRSRTSTEQYRDPARNMSDIGTALNANYILEGSFQKVENKANLTVQLIIAETDEHIWAEDYNKDWSDIFKVQSEVAQMIAKEIQVVISPQVKKAIETDPTTDLTAYDFYLRGKDFRNRGLLVANMSQMYEKAEEMYEKAVEIDSNFVLAWAGLVEINRELFHFQSKYWFQPKYFKGSKEDYLKKVQPQIDKTKSYLDKAIALAPDRMEVRREEGAYYLQCFSNYPKALQVLEKLHVDYPKDYRTIFLISAVWKRMGQSEKSLDYLNKAITLNRSDWKLWLEAGINLQILRRYDEAEKFYAKANLLNPYSDGFFHRLFYLYCSRRKIMEAKQYLEEHKDIINENRLRRYNIRLLWEEGNFEKSIREVENIPYDSTISSNSFSLHHELGWKYMHLMHKEKQKEHFQKAKDIFENLPIDTYKGTDMYSRYATALAGLGMITQALDTINKILEVADIIGRDNLFLNTVQWNKTIILAVSGNHDALFDQMNYILNRYGGMINLVRFKCNPSQIKCDPFWSQFSEFQRFQEIINNPEYQENPLEN